MTPRFALATLALTALFPLHAQEAAPSLPRVVHPEAATLATDTGRSYNWYVSPSLGWVRTDLDRHTDNPVEGGLSVGRWVNPNMTVDVASTLANAGFDPDTGRAGDGWEMTSLGVVGRWYGATPQDATRPYVLAGIGGVRHAAVAGIVHPSGWSPMATVGVGVEHQINDRAAIRGEVAWRQDRDAISSKYAAGLPRRDHYNDAVASVGLVIGLGHIAQPWVAYHQDLGNPPAPPAPTCDQADDDGDGVNNCDDRCVGTASGVLVGPDGCPQKVVIDLRGVNFKFDRPRPGDGHVEDSLAEPTQDSLDVLNQAVDLLRRYATIQVDIAGYTDAVGSEAYNQALSQRRAQAVADYLLAHGVDRSRIAQVSGEGESHPLALNTTVDGRAQNRRVEFHPEDGPAPSTSTAQP